MESIISPEFKKALASAVRVGGDATLRFADGVCSVEISKTIRSSDPFDNGKRTLRFQFEGRIRSGHLDATVEVGDPGYTYRVYSDEQENVYEPAGGCWVGFGLLLCRIYSAVRYLPNGAAIRFLVYLDAHSNANCAAVGAHGDALQMEVRLGDGKGNENQLQFELDSAVGPHNSARFGYSNMRKQRTV